MSSCRASMYVPCQLDQKCAATDVCQHPIIVAKENETPVLFAIFVYSSSHVHIREICEVNQIAH